MKYFILTAVCLLLSLPSPAGAASGSAGSAMTLIKGGTFTMGSPENEPWRRRDETQHPATLSDFFIGRREVTQEQFKALMGSEPGTFKGANLPVENVTWFEAVQYCNALSQKEGLTPAYAISGSGEAMTVT